MCDGWPMGTQRVLRTFSKLSMLKMPLHCLNYWAFKLLPFPQFLRNCFKSFLANASNVCCFVWICLEKCWRSRVENASVMTQFVEKFWLITSITLFLLAHSAACRGTLQNWYVEISSKMPQKWGFFLPKFVEREIHLLGDKCVHLLGC